MKIAWIEDRESKARGFREAFEALQADGLAMEVCLHQDSPVPTSNGKDPSLISNEINLDAFINSIAQINVGCLLMVDLDLELASINGVSFQDAVREVLNNWPDIKVSDRRQLSPAWSLLISNISKESSHQGIWALVSCLSKTSMPCGVIQISASSYGDRTHTVTFVEEVLKHTGLERKFQVREADHLRSLNVTKEAMFTGINLLKNLCGDILTTTEPTLEKRLWPAEASCWRKYNRAWEKELPAGATPAIIKEIWGGSTQDWYGDNSKVVQHNYPITDSKKQASVQTALWCYLTNLYGFSPPQIWFEEDCKSLHTLLKGLIGTFSAVQGNAGHLFSVQAALLLIPACIAEELHGRGERTADKQSVSLADPHTWTTERMQLISFSNEEVKMLPTQNEQQARASVMYLCEFWQKMLVKEGEPEILVVEVESASPACFTVSLTLNFSVTSKNDRESLIHQIVEMAEEEKGETYIAYQDFIKAAAHTKEHYREALFVLNFKVVHSMDGKRTVLELRAVCA